VYISRKNERVEELVTERKRNEIFNSGGGGNAISSVPKKFTTEITGGTLSSWKELKKHRIVRSSLTQEENPDEERT